MNVESDFIVGYNLNRRMFLGDLCELLSGTILQSDWSQIRHSNDIFSFFLFLQATEMKSN